MRPSRWAIASLVLFAGLAVPAARADTIFVLSLGPNTTCSDEMTILSSPDITYNSTSMSFTTTGLELSFDGFDFPMNPTGTVALPPQTDSYEWAVLTAGPEIIDESLKSPFGESIFLCNTSLIGSGCGASNVGGPPEGVASLTPFTATPEPATGGLMLIGVGLLGANASQEAHRPRFEILRRPATRIERSRLKGPIALCGKPQRKGRVWLSKLPIKLNRMAIAL
jgi:hypothetical protein